MLYTGSRKQHYFRSMLSTLSSSRRKKCSKWDRQTASQLAERSRLCAEQCEEARHRSWTPAALSANVFLVADDVRCCLKTGLHWAVLCRAGGESERQILPRGFVEKADAASRASHYRWHVRVSAGQRTGAPCSRDISAAAAGHTTIYLPNMWPPNSLDLNAVDYRICSWMQERVYKTFVRDTNDLKQHLIDNFRCSCFPR